MSEVERRAITLLPLLRFSGALPVRTASVAPRTNTFGPPRRAGRNAFLDADIWVYVVGLSWRDPFSWGGHSAIYLQNKRFRGGFSAGGDHDFQNGRRAFIDAYLADGRSIAEFKIALPPFMAGNMADFIENGQANLDSTAFGANCMLTQNCTTAVGNAFRASGAITSESRAPGEGEHWGAFPSTLIYDLLVGDHSEFVSEYNTYYPWD